MQPCISTEMIQASKAVYVRKQPIKCQNCGYEWLSETKVTPDTRKKRVCCSKCRSSITVTFFDFDNDNNSDEPTNPNLVKSVATSVKPKSVQEFREISDPESAIDYRMLTEIQNIARQNETEIIKILDDLDDRDPLPPLSDQQNKILDEKMKQKTFGEQFIIMLTVLRETFQKHYDRLNGDIPPDLVVHFERCIEKQRIYADFLRDMEIYELNRAQESDRRQLYKEPKKKRSRKIASKRRRLKLKC